jgi:hypothetical protein
MTAARKKKEEGPTPKVSFKRNTHGLLNHIDYIFNEEGLIDWRKMVDSKHLVPNRQYTNETDVSKLRDNQLLILLAGIKELSQIRGYTSVEYNTVSPSSDYVVATCKITWIPNFETEDKAMVFSSIGDASPSNTVGFGQLFLAACAENRAFVRCVRNFLKIHVVAQEEIVSNSAGVRAYSPVTQSANDSGNAKPDPKVLLEETMKDKGLSFSGIKKKLVEEGFEGSEAMVSVSDIPNVKIFELVQRMKKLPPKS